MKTHGKILLIMLISSFSMSCFTKPEFAGIQSFKFDKQTENGLLAQLAVNLKNENSYGLRGKDIKYNVLINNQLIGTGNVPGEVKLLAKQITTINNDVEILFAPLQSVFEFISDKDSIPVDFDVSGKFTFMGISINQRIRQYINKQELIDQLLDQSKLQDAYTIKNISIVSGNLEKSNLRMDIEFRNDYPIAFTIDSLIFDIYSDKSLNKKLGDWQSVAPVEIQASSTSLIKANVQVDNLSMATSIFTKIFSADNSFYLKGNAFFALNGQKVKIPLEQKIQP